MAALGIDVGKSPQAFKVAAGRVYADVTPLLREPGRWARVASSLGGKDPVAAEVLRAFLERNRAAMVAEKSKLRLPFTLLQFALRFSFRVLDGFFRPGAAEKQSKALADRHLARIRSGMPEALSSAERFALIERGMLGSIEVLMLQCAYFVPALWAQARLAARLRRWFGSDECVEAVIHGIPNNPTTQMGVGLVEIASRLKREESAPSAQDPRVRAFMREFGHRSNVELDIGVPRWSEDPEYILNLLASYMEQDTTGLRESLWAKRENAEVAIREIVSAVRRKKGGLHAWRTRRELRLIRSLLGLRERPKFDLIRSFQLYRQILAEIGGDLAARGVIADSSDVFFLKRREIERADRSLITEVEERMRAYDRQKQIRTIPRFIANTGETLYGSSRAGGTHRLTGVPISPGEYTGTVRVVNDPRAAQLRRGEVLVTHSSDPNWTPLFVNAGALVMETGGPTSHGGIVAREYGIPAVAGIERVSEKLPTGVRVVVDGSSGEVTIVE